MTQPENGTRRLPLALTILGALLRLIPHPPNFTPVGGMSLFAGARLSGWQCYLVPVVLMAITDPLLQLLFGVPAYTPITPFIYMSFLLSVWIGRHLRATTSVVRIGGATFLASLQFFLITNFAHWMFIGMYPKTASGLVACYVAALPFFGRTLAGDLVYAGAFFGLYAWMSRYSMETRPAQAR
jgi:hypothetical protein